VIQIPTIKGPIKIEAGKPLPDKLLKNVRLPFTATGWQSSRLSELVTKEASEPTESKEPSEITEEYLRSLHFYKLREFARRFGVRGRGRDEIIRELREKGVIK